MNTQNNTFVSAAKVVVVSIKPIKATSTAAIIKAIAHPNIANLTPVRLQNWNIVTFPTQIHSLRSNRPLGAEAKRVGVHIHLNINKTSGLQAFWETGRVDY
jgi:hypothetical protein